MDWSKPFSVERIMPIYEYKCKTCGAVSEQIQKFSDDPLTDCPECGGVGSLEKLMSLSAFHLKGSGWYLTDYARKNSGPTSSDSSQAPEKTTEKKPSNDSSGGSSDSAE
jgi:putative FmdB family regulatory protein